MNAPPLPERISAPIIRTARGDVLHDAPALRVVPIPEVHGFALQLSTMPEHVYLLGHADGNEVCVPCRECGTWNPAVLSGRHFFLAHEPDWALDLTSVRRTQLYIGRLAFPSGTAASPWFCAHSAKSLHRRLLEFSADFLEQRIARSASLSRVITRPLRR